MSADSETLPLWLRGFVQQSATRAIDWGQVMAASTIVAVPVIIFFLIVQGRMTADWSPGRSRADGRADTSRLPEGGRPMRVGLDVGGTKIDAVVVDPTGAIAARVRLATGWGAEEVIDTVIAAVHAVATDAGVDAGIDQIGRDRHPRSGRSGLPAASCTR